MRQIRKGYTPANGYQRFWDDTAQAPFMYNTAHKVFLTYDDERSVTAKAEYVKKKKLNGIMFWELQLDISRNGLLSIISQKFSGDIN